MHADSGTTRRQLGRLTAGGVAISVIVAGACALTIPAGATPSTPSDYTLSVVAGVGGGGTPTPGPATASHLGEPDTIARDAQGNVYVTDEQNSLVEKITPAGNLSVIAGNGVFASSNNPTRPGPATATPLGEPYGLAVAPNGDVYLADYTNSTIDKITPSGQLSIVAGVSGRSLGPALPYGTKPTPGVATATVLGNPAGLALDKAGNLYFSDWFSNTVIKVSAADQLTIIAGNGDVSGHAPVPGPATGSPLYYPFGVAVDPAGNVFLADEYNNDIDKITPDGVLSVVAGKGPTVTGAPTPGPAVDSALYYPTGVALDNLGNFYIADSYNSVVEKVTPNGTLSVIAGQAGSNGTVTPGPALASVLNTPTGVTVDSEGNVYVSDIGNDQVYKLAVAPNPPMAPRALHAAGPDSIAFAPPLRTGNLPITAYEFSVDGGATWQTATVTGSAPTLVAAIPGLAAGHRHRVQLRAVNALGDSPAAGVTLTVPAKPTGARWYVDPLSHTQRAHLSTVPKHPSNTHGKTRLTKAAYRTRHGHLAVPASKARGHQLARGQAVQATSLFAFDSATLTPAGRASLRQLATSLRHAHRITCEGYADYAGTRNHELRLSTRRAAAVCAALHHDRPGLRTHAIGYGPANPVVIGGAPTQRAANRRVDILVNR